MGRFLRLALVGGALAWIVSFLPALAGGWAVVTLETFPTGLMPDREFTVAFWVRQHGVSLADGLTPVVHFYHVPSAVTLSFPATSRAPGYYSALVRLPRSGTWEWWINTEFGRSPMPALTVGSPAPLPAGSPLAGFPARSLPALGPSLGGGLAALAAAAWLARPGPHAVPKRAVRAVNLPPKRMLAGGLLGLGSLLVALAGATWFGEAPDGFQPIPGCGEAYEVGKALFVAKGCVTCHPHARVEYAGVRVGVGPDLTGLGRAGSGVSPGSEYLRAWLKNPQAVRPQTQMPNLGLSDREIDYLLAFLLDLRKGGGRPCGFGPGF